jgi:hypothetical protein
MSHQHAGGRRRRDVDVADIDGAAHHRLEARQGSEDLARYGRGAVGNDQIDLASGDDQAGRIERRLALVQDDIDQRLQARQRAGAVILRACPRHVAEQQAHGALYPWALARSLRPRRASA